MMTSSTQIVSPTCAAKRRCLQLDADSGYVMDVKGARGTVRACANIEERGSC